MSIRTKKSKNLGFVLLFTLLISSILLATGLGVSRLMVRQIGLASLNRDSQVAFFAADSGMECAQHWDGFKKFDILSPPSPSESRTIYCNGIVIEHDKAPNPGEGIIGVTANDCDLAKGPPEKNIISGGTKSCFTFSLANGKDSSGRNRLSCAFVVVEKTVDSSVPLNPVTTTKITSNGYNRCDLSLPNVLQRTLEFTSITCDSSDQKTCAN